MIFGRRFGEYESSRLSARSVLSVLDLAKHEAMERDINKIYLNELNTIPGFTKISMHPKLCEARGLPYNQLMDRLSDFAMERNTDRDYTLHTYWSEI